MQDATHSSTQSQKSYYDKRPKRLQCKQGQLFWLYWPKPPVRQRFRKLSQLWTGPWRIEYFKSPVVCQIVSTTGRVVRQIVNVDRLTPCMSPDIELHDSDRLTDTETSDDDVFEHDSHVAHSTSIPKILRYKILAHRHVIAGIA